MTSSSKRFVVVGSVNWDIVVQAPRLPRPGETVIGTELMETQGGKGANQAVALARLGHDVEFLGRVGADSYGDKMRSALNDSGVGTTHVLETDQCSSGVAIITVDERGENCITAIPGANERLTPADVEAHRDLIASADVLLVQYEIPLESVAAAIQIARSSECLVIMDPAPYKVHSIEALFDVDFICPNETEAELITGLEVETEADVIKAAERIAQKGAQHSIVTCGDQGAIMRLPDGQIKSIAAFAINAIDTTAAGDAFAAGLASALAQGLEPIDAVKFANAAGAVAASRLGALPSMPSRADVEALVNSQTESQR